MSLIPMAPPNIVQSARGFDYVAVDATRRRIYAAHTSNTALLVADADSGKVIREIHVGKVQGVAVDPQNGYVYTGDGIDRNVREIDPVSGTVLRTVDVGGDVDAVAFDPDFKRIYADEDDGNRVFVIDARTMKQIGVVALPGNKPEYLAVDPQTHEVYQNISDLGEYVVINPRSLHVTKIVHTGILKNNHPLQFDHVTRNVIVGGDGTLARFDTAGKELGRIENVGKMDQCNLNQLNGTLVCAGGGKLSEYDARSGSTIHKVDEAQVSKRAHTVAIDPKTGVAWTVWSESTGEYLQGFRR